MRALGLLSHELRALGTKKSDNGTGGRPQEGLDYRWKNSTKMRAVRFFEKKSFWVLTILGPIHIVRSSFGKSSSFGSMPPPIQIVGWLFPDGGRLRGDDGL